MPDRHQFRAKWHDYNRGIYFVTICCHSKKHLLGKIIGTQFIASELGEIAKNDIKNITSYYSNVMLHNFVIMPNHIHLMIQIASALPTEKGKKIGCLKPRMHEPLNSQDFHHNAQLESIIGALKAGITRQARTRLIAFLPEKLWQPRFHEHIVRNQRGYENIMHYIDTNVENWGIDCFNK